MKTIEYIYSSQLFTHFYTMNYKLIFTIVFLSLFQVYGVAQSIPNNFQLVYEQNFEKKKAVKDFEFSDPSAWRLGEKEGKKVLELYGESQYEGRVRSPFNIALLKNHQFGDFVLEVELSQTGREYGHRDLCLFFGAKDASNFYYVHMASVADDHANNIFLVNDEPRVKIGEKTTSGTNWGATNSWHKAKIVREIESGKIQVFFDDMKAPIMEATDTHFDFGRIGFGSFDDTGCFDNIRIYAPKSVKEKDGFFK